MLHNSSISYADKENLKLGDSVSVSIVSNDNNGRISLALSKQPAEKPEQVLSKGLLDIGGQFFLDKKCFSLVNQLSSGTQLGPNEFTVLRCLFQHLGETVPYECILQELDGSENYTRIIYSSVHKLNLIFNNNDININIENERGKGYYLKI